MNRKHYLAPLIPAILILSCGADSIHQKNSNKKIADTAINILVQNPHKANLELGYTDKFNDNTILYTNEDSSTVIKSPGDFLPLQIKYGNKHIMIPLVKGDSFEIVSMDGKTWNWRLLSSGKLEFDTSFFDYCFKRLSYEYDKQKLLLSSLSPTPIDKSKPFVIKTDLINKKDFNNKYFGQAKKINTLEWALIDSLQKCGKLSKTYRNIYGAVINAKYINEIIRCYDQTKVNKYYDSLLTSASLFGAEYLKYDAGRYKEMLVNYIQSIISKGKFHKYGLHEIMIDYRSAYDSAHLYFKKPLLGYIHFFCLKNIQEQYASDEFQKYFDEFKKEGNDSSYADYLLSNSSVKITNSDYDLLLNETGSETNTIKSIVEENKGKVLYLDLWASWCLPCIEAIPASKKLFNEYASKPIKFIYLSIDDNKRNWKNGSIKVQLSTDSNSYIFDSPRLSPFLKSHSVSSIPRYMVIDKRGDVINSNAPAPGTKEIREILSGLLK